ncbi:putative H/ACA ribonucleoprotein complex subunit-like protein 1 [Sesamum angolense]|uniref:H/ACA ribonucleoprotein complex subunit n=1 Tax=Sesamum angolense TaxID=2727404 RepID=A0AAE1WFA1_9LAMI|nr:putative H/ACA ribonucleoprotein complex subunit-like protein 1 [Sesamum angolense]
MRPPRGRGGGGFRGGRDGGGRGGRGGRGGGRFPPREEGPPSEVVEVSTFLHACEGDAVTKLTNEKIPYFNAPIYLANKTQIGKVDEISDPSMNLGQAQAARGGGRGGGRGGFRGGRGGGGGFRGRGAPRGGRGGFRGGGRGGGFRGRGRS